MWIGQVIIVLSAVIAVATITIPMTIESGKRRAFADRAVELLLQASQWPIVLSDDFQENDINWHTGNIQEDDASCDRSISNGKYQWNMEVSQREIVLMDFARINPIWDLYLSVDAHLASSKGSWESYFGLLVLTEDLTNAYAFTHSERTPRAYAGGGTAFAYWCYQILQLRNSEWTSVDSDCSKSRSGSMAFPGDPGIRHPPDGIAHLTVVAQDANLNFFIDGEFVATVSDDQFISGAVGLLVFLPEAGEDAIVEFDNLVLRAP